MKENPFLEAMIDKLREMATDPKRQRASDGTFHPSAMTGCTRQLYYTVSGAEAKSQETPRGVLTLWHGTKIHELLQDLLKQMYGDRFTPEVAFKTTDPITGSTDGVIVLKTKHADGTPFKFGVEIKSIKPDKYKKLKDGPVQAHVEQATIYMACLGLDFMQMIYYNKSDEPESGEETQLRAFKVEMDQGIWNKAKNKIKVVKASIESEEPPAREVSYLCRYCSFFHICKPEL